MRLDSSSLNILLNLRRPKELKIKMISNLKLFFFFTFSYHFYFYLNIHISTNIVIMIISLRSSHFVHRMLLYSPIGNKRIICIVEVTVKCLPHHLYSYTLLITATRHRILSDCARCLTQRHTHTHTLVIQIQLLLI